MSVRTICRVTRHLILLVVVLLVVSRVGAEWSRMHPAQDSQYLGRFYGTSLEWIEKGRHLVRPDWENQRTVETGIPSLPGNPVLYGKDGIWSWERSTIVSDGKYLSENSLYHVEKLADWMSNPDADAFAVPLPPIAEHSDLTEIVATSDDGRFVLFRVLLSEPAYRFENRLVEWDPTAGWLPPEPVSGEWQLIGGRKDDGLFAVVDEISDAAARRTLQTLVEGEWIEVTELEYINLDTVPMTISGAANGDRFIPPPVYPPPPPPFSRAGLSRVSRLEVTEARVYVKDHNTLYIYNPGDGTLLRQDVFISNDFVITSATDQSGELVYLSGGTIQRYNWKTETREQLAILPQAFNVIDEIRFDENTASWHIVYNRVSLARTRNWLDFEHINPSFFAEEIKDIETVGAVLYVLTTHQLRRWSRADGWSGSIGLPELFDRYLFSITYDQGTFYLGSLGAVIKTEDFQSFTVVESDALVGFDRNDLISGNPQTSPDPAVIDQMFRFRGWTWVIITEPFYPGRGRVNVLRSVDLDDWELVGTWDHALLGHWDERAPLLVYTRDEILAIDKASAEISEIELPAGIRAFQTTFGPGLQSAVAGRGAEILAIVRNDDNRKQLIRYNPLNGWQTVQDDLPGQAWSFLGVTDRYHLQVTRLPDFEGVAETIHGDAFVSFDADGPLRDFTELDGSVLALGRQNEIFERNLSPAETMFADNQYIEDGWWYQDEIGYLYLDQPPWIYTPSHGWWHVNPAAHGGWFLHDRDLNWIYSSPELYPHFYEIQRNRWLRYQEGSGYPSRWFYDFGGESWITVGNG